MADIAPSTRSCRPWPLREERLSAQIYWRGHGGGVTAETDKLPNLLDVHLV
jgi:hypothetical protein